MIYEKDERKPLIWLSGGHFVNDIYTGILNPIMPFIAERVHISMGIATIILSVAHVFSSLSQPIFGYFADKIRKRSLIFWGLLFTSIFISNAPGIMNVFQMVLCVALGNLGSSLFHPQALGLVLKYSTSSVSKNMGIFIALGTLGFSVGPLCSSAIAQHLGLDKMFYMCILGVVWAFCMFFMLPKFPNEPLAKTPDFSLKQAFLDILKNDKLKILNLIAILKSLIQTSCSILLPFLWKSMGYSKFQIGFSLFCFLFLGGIASFISPRLENKIGTANVFYISMILTFPMMLIFLFTYRTMPIVSFIDFALMGFVTLFAVPVTMSMAQKVLPQYKSIIGGLINGFSWGVVAIAMTIIGFVAQATNIAVVLAVIAFIPAITSLFVVRKLFSEPN